MDAHPADAGGLGDGGRTMPSLAHLPHFLNRHGGFAAFVDALRLGRFDARLLTLPDEPTLHLGHHAQHRHEDRPPPGASLVEKAGSKTVRAAPLASKPRPV